MIWKGAASIYFLGGSIYVHPVREGKKVDPVTTLDDGAEPEAVGRAIRSAMLLSLDAEVSDAEAGRRVLTAMRMKSWRAVEKQARVITVYHKESEVVIVPMFKYENRSENERGLVGEPAQRIEEKASDAELGEALRRWVP